MRITSKAGVILGLEMALFSSHAGFGQAGVRIPVVTTPRFAFYSDFEPNLNDALIAAGVARKPGKPELFHSGAEASCFGKLPESARAAWDGAVDYYVKIISPAGSNSRQQYLLRAQLAGFEEELKGDEARQFVEIARSFRAAATPAYRACRWAAQDEKNRRWIEELKPRLAADEQKIGPMLEELYRKKWTGLPIPVDVVETVDWSGANTILRDAGSGHILISAENPGRAALEVVFHEASHILMGGGAPVRQALESAASAANFRMPGELWHVVLFYTTGEAVRRVLDDGSKPAYTPLVYEIFDRGWGGYRKPLETAWRPYVDGGRTLSEAAASLIGALTPPMDLPRLREFAARYTAAWCSRDPASVAAFFGERGSLQINKGSPSIGRAAIAAAAQGFMTAFPDLVVKMNDVSLEGVHAIYRWTLSGTNTGPGGTGRAVRIRGYEEWEMGADGLIAESRGHFDEAEYQRQLKSGAAPPP
jgi:hypothetical protein